MPPVDLSGAGGSAIVGVIAAMWVGWGIERVLLFVVYKEIRPE